MTKNKKQIPSEIDITELSVSMDDDGNISICGTVESLNRLSECLSSVIENSNSSSGGIFTLHDPKAELTSFVIIRTESPDSIGNTSHFFLQ